MTDLVAQSHQRRLEAGVREWICEAVGESAPGDTPLLEWLKDGVLLCRLCNALRPHSVPRINAPATLSFKQLENLSNACAAFKALGVSPSVVFSAGDFQAARSADRLLASLDSIRRHFASTSPAPPPAADRRPESSTPVRHHSAHALSLSSSASLAQARVLQAAASARPASLPSSPASAVVALPAPVLAVAAEPPLRTSTSSALQRPSAATVDVSTLSADTETAKEFKYNPETERKVRTWVECVIGALPEESFHAALKSGVALCRLFAALHPTAPKLDKVYEGKVAYLQMQNISLYIKACETAGMRQIDLFDTTDLFDNKNLNAVLNHIVTLASRCAKRPGYNGPVLEDVKGDRNLFSQSLVADNAPFLQTGAAAPEYDEGALSRGDRNMLAWVRTTVAQAGGTRAPVAPSPLPLAATAARALHWQDLRSGVVLLHLLEKLCDTDVGFFHERPSLLWHAMQNASLVLRAVEKHTNGAAVSGCSARDIVQGERSGLLALLRFLRERYDMAYLFQSKLLEEQRLEGDAFDDAIAAALDDAGADDNDDGDDGDDGDDDERGDDAQEAERQRLALLAERQALESAERAIELKRRESYAKVVAAASQPGSRIGTPQRRTSTRVAAMPPASALQQRLAALLDGAEERTATVLSDVVALGDVDAVVLSPRRKSPAAAMAIERIAVLQDADVAAAAAAAAAASAAATTAKAESDDSADESPEPEQEADAKLKKSRKHKESSTSGKDEKRKKAKSKKKSRARSSAASSASSSLASSSSSLASSRSRSKAAVEADAAPVDADTSSGGGGGDLSDVEVLAAEYEQLENQKATLRAKRQALDAKLEAISRPAFSAPRPSESTIARKQRGQRPSDVVAAAAAPASTQVSAAYAAVRQQVAKEFLSTERSYVASLSRVCDELRQPLCDLLARNEPILIGNEIEQIFGNLAALRDQHVEFLGKLDETVSAWSEATPLGVCLKTHLTFLQDYARYLRSYEEAQVHLHVCRRTRPDFGAMLSEFEAPGASLSSLLVMPVQRIPRYLLLLDSMCKYTPTTHADFATLKAVRGAMQKKLAALNDGLDKSSSLASDAAVVMRIERAIDGVDTLVVVGRRFVCEGRLKLKAVERSGGAGSDAKLLSMSLVALGREKPKLVKQQFWLLFSDALVYTEQVDTDVASCMAPLSDDGKQPFLYQAELPLSSVVSVERALPGSKEDRAFQFTVHTQLERLVFAANSATERDNWWSAIRDLVANNKA
jgi:hypothetical protein